MAALPFGHACGYLGVPDRARVPSFHLASSPICRPCAVHPSTSSRPYIGAHRFFDVTPPHLPTHRSTPIRRRRHARSHLQRNISFTSPLWWLACACMVTERARRLSTIRVRALERQARRLHIPFTRYAACLLLTVETSIALASAPYQEGETNTHAVKPLTGGCAHRRLASTGHMEATAETKRR